MLHKKVILIRGDDFLNIRQYYTSTAKMYLNISLFAGLLCILLIVCSLVFFQSKYMWQITTPFMFFSIFYFICHIVNRKRALKIPHGIQVSDTKLFDEKNILFMFLPAPSLRLLLFHPIGTLLGEIKEHEPSWYKWLIPNSISMLLSHTFKLTDCNNKTLATYKMSHFLSRKVCMYDETGNVIAIYKENKMKSMFRYKGSIEEADGSLIMMVDVSGILQTFSLASVENKPLVSFQRGFMPLEWGKSFQDLNTPIITFSKEVSKNEQICVYGLCTRLLHHHKN